MYDVTSREFIHLILGPPVQVKLLLKQMHDYFLTRVGLYKQINQTKALPITKQITCRYEPGHTSSNVKLVESEYDIGEEKH